MKSILVMVMAILLSFTVGCAKKTTTVNTPEGKVEIQQQGDNITINTPEGKTEVTEQGGNITAESEEGKVEVTKDGGSVTVESDKGKLTMGKTDVAPKDLGVPVYPGASQEGNITMTGSDNNGENAAHVILNTKDPFDKVVAFYKEQLPSAKTTNVNTPETSVAMFELEKDGKMIHVSISVDKNREITAISIVSQEAEKKE